MITLCITGGLLGILALAAEYLTKKNGNGKAIKDLTDGYKDNLQLHQQHRENVRRMRSTMDFHHSFHHK